MNKSKILELVFSGENYAEKMKMHDNETYTKCYKELEQKLEKLCEGMSKDERHDFLWDIFMLQGGIESAASEEFFKEGFKLGMTIAAQCFLD